MATLLPRLPVVVGRDGSNASSSWPGNYATQAGQRAGLERRMDLMLVVTVVAVLALLVSVPVLYLRALRNEQWRGRK